MEAAELAMFMLSACAFTVLLYHPASPLANSFPNDILRRALMGIAMGTTAIAIIFSPLGKRSGAHFNPSVTLAFLRLGKVAPWDAAFYIAAQFIGGIAGVIAAMWLLGPAVADQHVNYATTQPGSTRTTRRLCRRTDHFVRPDVRCFACLKHEETCAMDGRIRRRTRRNLHHFRITNLRHEHESGAYVWLGFWSRNLDVAVDLFRRAADWNAVSRRSFHEESARRIGALRKVSPLQQSTLHLQMQLRTNHLIIGRTSHESTKHSCVFSSGDRDCSMVIQHVRSNSRKGTTKFKVRIENISNADGFSASNGMKWPFAISPGAYSIHRGSGNPLFKVGSYAGHTGLEAQAEDGIPEMLILRASNHAGVLTNGTFKHPIGAAMPGPVTPGAAFEFEVRATPGAHLFVTFMFGQSNDLFFGNRERHRLV